MQGTSRFPSEAKAYPDASHATTNRKKTLFKQDFAIALGKIGFLGEKAVMKLSELPGVAAEIRFFWVTDTPMQLEKLSNGCLREL